MWIMISICQSNIYKILLNGELRKFNCDIILMIQVEKSGQLLSFSEIIG